MNSSRIVKYTFVLFLTNFSMLFCELDELEINISYPRIIAALHLKLSKLSDTLNIEPAIEYLQDETQETRALKETIRLGDFVLPPTSFVYVASSLNLSAQENKFIAKRLKKIQPLLQQTFNIAQPLRIGFCCSGGGVRAMIGTMGILQAAARAKILQVSMFLAGLSGSTWLIAPWSYLYLQKKLHQNFEISLQQMVQNWTTVLDDASMRPDIFGIYFPALLSQDQALTFSYQVAQRWSYNQPITLVDLYGALVGNFVLALAGDDKLKVAWSSVAKKLQDGDIPLPLCSAIFDTAMQVQDKVQQYEKYGWFEFTPFESGGTEIGYIPLQYLGSAFRQGQLDTSIGQLRPEYPLSFIMGVCGSAFAFNIEDLTDKTLPSPTFSVDTCEMSVPVDALMRRSVDDSSYFNMHSNKRFETMYGRFFNFSFNLANSILKGKEELGIFDAGIYFNFPLPALLDRPDRKVDLIFMYDSTPGDEESLKEAAAYYKSKGKIAIPDMSRVSTKSLLAKVMTVFNDPRVRGYDAKKPTFIYFPTRGFDVTQPPYITLNFKYTQAQMKKLIHATDFAFTSQVSEIKKIMKLVAKARHT